MPYITARGFAIPKLTQRIQIESKRANEYLHNLFLRAAKNGEVERIRNFLKRSTRNNNVNIDYKDKNTGNTAIFLAAQGNHLEVVRLLLNYGADITLHNQQGHSVVELAPKSIQHVLLASVERQGVSHRHLLQAAWQGNVEILKRLLAGLNINCKNADGMTPLLLVTRDIDLFEKFEKEVTERGYHPLDVLKELLQRKANLSAVNKHGTSALHYVSSCKGQTANEMAKVLIEDQECCLELRDEFDCHPIHVASREDNFPVLLALINGGADVNAKGFDGQTPLHISASHGHERSSSVLIKNGADITLVDNHGNSPVDIAANKTMHRVLREAWAQQTKSNSPGKRRSMSAPSNKHSVLKEAGQESHTISPKEKKSSPRKSSSKHGTTAPKTRSSSDSEHKNSKPVVKPNKSLVVKATPSRSRNSLPLTRPESTRPQTRQISSRSQDTAIFPQERLELPKLSVKNIELHYTNSLQPEFPNITNIQHMRILTPGHSRSLPATPCSYGTYRSGSARRNLELTMLTTQRNKIPTRIAPLPGTPELPPSALQPSFGNIENVVDLDLLQNGPSYLTALAKLGLSSDDNVSSSLCQPPSSPSDMDNTETNIRETERDVQINESELQLTSFDEAEVKDNEIKDKIEIEQEDTKHNFQTQTITLLNSNTMWIPNALVNHDTTFVENETIKKREENMNSISSCRFYIDLNDVSKDVKCTSCGKPIDSTANKLTCPSCSDTQKLTEKVHKPFWISMDGETSDGESERPDDTNKIRYSKEANKSPNTRKTKSLPSSCQPLLPYHDQENLAGNKQNDVFKLTLDRTFIKESISENDRAEADDGTNGGLTENDNEFKMNTQIFRTENVTANHQSDRQNVELLLKSEKTFVIDSNEEGKTGWKTTQGSDDPGKKSSEFINIEQEECNKEAASCTEVLQENEKDSDCLGKGTLDSINTRTLINTCNVDNPITDNELLTNENKEDEALETSIKSNDNDSSSRNTIGLDIVESSVTVCSAQTNGVQICNAFPSPVPPTCPKPDVHPAIGEMTPKRKTSGKKGRKGNLAETKKIIKSKPKSGKEQGKKGKKKSKKKEDASYKEITVNQSNADEAYMPEAYDFPCPDLDSAPTLSIDSKPLSGKLKVFSNLSPIPESPYSNRSTPQSLKLQLSNTNTSDIIVNYEELDSNKRVIDAVKENKNINDKDALICKAGDSPEETEQQQHKEGCDETDGGIISRLFGMCIPRLNISNDDSDEEELMTSSNSGNNENISKEITNKEDQPNQSKEDCLSTESNDDDVEAIFKEILKNTDDIVFTSSINQKGIDTVPRKKSNTSVRIESISDLSEDDDLKLRKEVDLLLEETKDDFMEKQRNKTMKQQWTMEYIEQISHDPNSQSELPIISTNQSEKSEFDTLTSHSAREVFVDDPLSDNDSSYISCDSTPRGVSDCSTFESNDSVLSPQSSQCTTPHCSVDITSHEKTFKTLNSSSSDSRSTISNNSVLSSRSFFAVNSRPFVRSQISTTSSSSATSCGAEIQWQKGNILGKGGFGTVWLGLVNTGKMIAVKQVELNHNDDAEAEKQYEKLQEEVSLLKSLRHENIVSYIGTCLDENFVVNIFMEYVPGGSIAQALKRFGVFVETVFRHYTKQILCGVEYLHVNNVMHRDIKGGNIMLMPNGVIKLIDFGCAKRLCMNLSLSRSSIQHSIKGTPYWMAPEVIKETGAGTKSDIWSIGCTVFEMATGSPPWSEMQPMAAIFSIGNGSTIPQLNESFSQLARDFTSACMTRDPDLRPSATDLLKHKFLN